jgi:DNA-binding beta-propeller fold protein YncE
VIDADRVEDDDNADLVRGAIAGFLPAPLGADRDLGAATVSSVGPAQMALLPDGVHLVTANFNQNSLSIYDLRMGTWGQMIGESEFLGENPSAVAITPDGRHAVVACYEGEVDEDTQEVDSTLAVVDVDPSSPSFLEVVTWIVNR